MGLILAVAFGGLIFLGAIALLLKLLWLVGGLVLLPFRIVFGLLGALAGLVLLVLLLPALLGAAVLFAPLLAGIVLLLPLLLIAGGVILFIALVAGTALLVKAIF